MGIAQKHCCFCLKSNKSIAPSFIYILHILPLLVQIMLLQHRSSVPFFLHAWPKLKIVYFLNKCTFNPRVALGITITCLDTTLYWLWGIYIYLYDPYTQAFPYHRKSIMALYTIYIHLKLRWYICFRAAHVKKSFAGFRNTKEHLIRVNETE